MSRQAGRERRIRQRLKDDLPHYAARCLKIRTKAGALEPLRLNKVQKYIHRKLEAQRAATGRVRALVLKARQPGVSTYVGARFYWKVTHGRGLRAFILTHRDQATANLFAMAKRFLDNSHVRVILLRADGGEDLWTETVEYNLTGVGAPGGGTVVVQTSPIDYTPQGDETLVIKLAIPAEQQTALPFGGAFPSTAVEGMADLAALRDQQIEEALSRTVKFKETTALIDVEFPEPDAGKFIRWDTAGTALVLSDIEEWLAGSGAPAGSLGDVGDFYLRTDTSDILEKTDTTTWTQRLNIQGADGLQALRFGSGAPAGGLGSVGDYYKDQANGDYFEKTGASAWTLRGNDTGPPGPDGAPGADGAAGQGVPVGGTAGQVLAKIDAVDFNTQWVTGGGGGGIGNLVEDTTPQLGGDLDCNNFGIALDDGSIANLSFSFQGDPNTGLYSVIGDWMVFVAGGNAVLDVYRAAGVNRVRIANGEFEVSGDITVGGLVDGRDVAADGTKLDGIAAGANSYSHPNHIGDVTSTGDGATVIANNAVSNAKAANMASGTIKGRVTAGAGDPEDLTQAQARDVLGIEILTQAAYNGITPVAGRLYFING